MSENELDLHHKIHQLKERLIWAEEERRFAWQILIVALSIQLGFMLAWWFL